MRELIVRGRWWLLAMVILAAPHARAQPAEPAQALFDDGLRLIKSGRISEACTAFEGSQKLDPQVVTLLNLADCREKNHQLATAWELFNQAKDMATAAGDAKLATVATNHATKLDPRLSHLVIAVPADRQITGLTVTRDKDPVAPASWNRPIAIDGGSYTISARAPGREPWSTTRAIKPEGDTQTVEIPKLTDAKAAAPAEPVAAASEPRVTAPGTAPVSNDLLSKEGTVSNRPSYVLPIAFGGGALAFGGVAGYLQYRASVYYDRAVERNERDPVGAQKLWDSHQARITAARVFVGAAVGCAGVAVYLFFRNRSESNPPATAMAPMVAPGLAGVALVGHW